MSGILIGCIKQSRAEKLEEIRQNRRDIKIGTILQSRGEYNGNSSNN